MSQWIPYRFRSPRAEELEGFRKAQRLAYQAAMAIGAEMKEGWTERQTADLIETYLRDHGVRSFFHMPFAWFGDRTRFEGVKQYKDFSPTHRAFKGDEVILLDVAPIVDGYVGDIGYSFCPVKNATFDKAMDFLRLLRKNIPLLVDSFKNRGRDLWEKVDREIREAGFDNIHQLYPFSVLGHQVHRVPLGQYSGRTPIPFSAHAFWSLLSRGLSSQLLNVAHQGPLEGLWAVEPHIGASGFGAKFEEILVVDKNGGAHWLDEQVPHLKAERKTRASK